MIGILECWGGVKVVEYMERYLKVVDKNTYQIAAAVCACFRV